MPVPLQLGNWCETVALGSRKEEKGVPSRPLGIWSWVALSLVSPTAAAARCEV